MNLIITINLDNAAFNEQKGSCLAEITRILNGITQKIQEEQVIPGKLRDINGNQVGRIIWTR